VRKHRGPSDVQHQRGQSDENYSTFEHSVSVTLNSHNASETRFMRNESEHSAAPSIGPHEGKELELMLASRKPLALFYAIESEAWVIPEEEFDCHVALGNLVKDDFLFKPTDPAAPVVKCVLYALPGESARIPEAVKILRHVFEELKAPGADQERMLGHLLGYTEEDIALYLS
jgi:hypothetical protein